MTKIRKNVVKDRIEASRISSLLNLSFFKTDGPSEDVREFLAFVDQLYKTIVDPNVSKDAKFRAEQQLIMIKQLIGMET